MSKAKVLIADDSQTVRDMLSFILAKEGFLTVTACDGIEAIEICGRTQGIRLLLTDVVMPKMSGRELVERITAAHPGIKTPIAV